MPENTGVAFSSVFLDKTPPVDVRIDEMLGWVKKLGAEDNLSFRTKMGFVINGGNIAPENITKDTVVEVRGVVFGLNRPSIYAKGQVTPAADTLLHSDVYEALPEINAMFCLQQSRSLCGTTATGSSFRFWVCRKQRASSVCRLRAWNSPQVPPNWHRKQPAW